MRWGREGKIKFFKKLLTNLILYINININSLPPMSRSPHVLKVVTHWYAFRLLARRFSMFTWIGAPNGGFALKNHQALLAAMCLGIASFSSQAATYYWDTNDSTAGFGTAGGTWAAPTTNNSTQGWSASSAGTSSLSGTTTTTTSDALNFGTGSDGLATGTVTVSGSLSAGSITFGSASGNITLGGAPPAEKESAPRLMSHPYVT
jgi:hypothetical protein